MLGIMELLPVIIDVAIIVVLVVLIIKGVRALQRRFDRIKQSLDKINNKLDAKYTCTEQFKKD